MKDHSPDRPAESPDRPAVATRLLAFARGLLELDDGDEGASAFLASLRGLSGCVGAHWLVSDGDGWQVPFDAVGVPASRRRLPEDLARALEAGGDRVVTRRSTTVGEGDVLVASFPQVGGARRIGLRLQGPAGVELGEPTEEAVREACELAAPLVGRWARRMARAAVREEAQRLLGAHDFTGIVTEDPAMLALLRQIVRIGPARASVLLHGPTGCGKELLARAIHANGARKPRPFVTVHCSAIPGGLLESELFGHVAGAFTGAHRDRSGRIAAAAGGTLFLDEVGEIPMEVQTKLLRFVQFGEIQRVGSDHTQTVDVRIVSATHRDLRDLVRRGVFREDLYYRLNVVTLSVPPLASRPSDVPLLLRHFLSHEGGPGRRFSARAERLLAGYAFPGNVRELSHIVERACILSPGPVLDVDALPPELAALDAGVAEAAAPASTPASLQEARQSAVAEAERTFLRTLMQRSRGNVSRAAREANMHRSYLQKLLAKHRGAVSWDEEG